MCGASVGPVVRQADRKPLKVGQEPLLLVSLNEDATPSLLPERRER